jgi:hypothetical protein
VHSHNHTNVAIERVQMPTGEDCETAIEIVGFSQFVANMDRAMVKKKKKKKKKKKGKKVTKEL